MALDRKTDKEVEKRIKSNRGAIVMLARYEEEKISASRYCVDIFNDFDESEIKDFPPSIQGAWKSGKRITEL